MFQLEVKRWLVFHRFPANGGWEVTVDIDAMERGDKGQQPEGKHYIATECELWLRSQGVRLSGILSTVGWISSPTRRELAQS
jgi:hypothetical protein